MLTPIPENETAPEEFTDGVRYTEQDGEGLLALRGTVDIFEAQAVHAASAAALAGGAAIVRLDSTGAVRLDLSALQVLAALRRDLEAGGRQLFSLHAEAAAGAAQAGLDL